MAVWNNVEKILLGTVCLTSLMLPYESFAAERPYDNKTTQRQSSSRREKEKRSNKKTPATKTTEEENKISSSLSPAELQKKIDVIRRGIERASTKDITAGQKKILLEAFDQCTQTEAGKKLFERVHDGLEYRVRKLSKGVSGTYGNGVSINVNIFENIEKAQTPQDRLSEMLFLVSNIIHETAHSEHTLHRKWTYPNSSFEEKIMTEKMAELHARFEETRGAAALLETAPYKDYHEKGMLKVSPTVSSYLTIKQEKLKETNDLKQAEQFANTTFITSFWENKGGVITVNDKEIPIREGATHVWNATYNMQAFSKTNAMRQYHDKKPAEQDVGLEPYFSYFIERMDLTIPPSYFAKNKSFDADQDRLIGYLNGIKILEIDALRAGMLTKAYRIKDDKSQLLRFQFKFYPLVQMKNEDKGLKGQQKEIYSLTRKPRAEYTMVKGKPDGIYTEYNEDGSVRLKFPIKEGKGNGYGRVIVDGKDKTFIFHNNTFGDNVVIDPEILTPESKAKYKKIYGEPNAEFYRGR